MLVLDKECIEKHTVLWQLLDKLMKATNTSRPSFILEQEILKTQLFVKNYFFI